MISRLLDRAIDGGDLVEHHADERRRGDVLEREQAGAQPVVDVMGVIGDVVGDRRRLRLGAGECIEPERKLRVELPHIGRQDARGLRAGERAIVLDDAFQRLESEIEPVIAGVTALQQSDDAQRLGVVVEAAVIGHTALQRALAGMAEGRVAEIMGERHRLGQIFIESERPRERPRDLPDLDRMRQPGAKMIAVERHEHLCLMCEAAEGRRMDDTVAVALELGAGRRGVLGKEPPARRRRIAGVDGAAGRRKVQGRQTAAPVIARSHGRPYVAGRLILARRRRARVRADEWKGRARWT